MDALLLHFHVGRLIDLAVGLVPVRRCRTCQLLVPVASTGVAVKHWTLFPIPYRGPRGFALGVPGRVDRVDGLG